MLKLGVKRGNARLSFGELSSVFFWKLSNTLERGFVGGSDGTRRGDGSRSRLLESEESFLRFGSIVLSLLEIFLEGSDLRIFGSESAELAFERSNFGLQSLVQKIGLSEFFGGFRNLAENVF